MFALVSGVDELHHRLWLFGMTEHSHDDFSMGIKSFYEYTFSRFIYSMDGNIDWFCSTGK